MMLAPDPTDILDLDVAKKVVAAIMLGETQEFAAIAAEVAPFTITKWRFLYPQFDKLLNKAQSDFRIKHLKRIDAASREGSWQASLALLERRFPEDFTKRAIVTGANGGPIEIVARRVEDYPFLANPAAREAACALIDALAIAQQDEDVAATHGNEETTTQ